MGSNVAETKTVLHSCRFVYSFIYLIADGTNEKTRLEEENAILKKRLERALKAAEREYITSSNDEVAKPGARKSRKKIKIGKESKNPNIHCLNHTKKLVERRQKKKKDAVLYRTFHLTQSKKD